jgi:hypothetical protein
MDSPQIFCIEAGVVRCASRGEVNEGRVLVANPRGNLPNRFALHLEQAANRRRLFEDLVPQTHAHLRKYATESESALRRVA